MGEAVSGNARRLLWTNSNTVTRRVLFSLFTFHYLFNSSANREIGKITQPLGDFRAERARIDAGWEATHTESKFAFSVLANVTNPQKSISDDCSRDKGKGKAEKEEKLATHFRRRRRRSENQKILGKGDAVDFPPHPDAGEVLAPEREKKKASKVAQACKTSYCFQLKTSAILQRRVVGYTT